MVGGKPTLRLLGSITLIAGTVVPAIAQNCRIDTLTARCIFVPAGRQAPPDFAVGDLFPVFERSLILDIDRYHLPPVDGAWRYYKSGTDIYKVDTQSHRVIDILRYAGR